MTLVSLVAWLLAVQRCNAVQVLQATAAVAEALLLLTKVPITPSQPRLRVQQLADIRSVNISSKHLYRSSLTELRLRTFRLINAESCGATDRLRQSCC
jgi:hypothetical protein